MPKKPQRTASLRVERDQHYPDTIFRAFLCEDTAEGQRETPQVLPCSFEGKQDVLYFFNIIEQFLADGGVIKKSS